MSEHRSSTLEAAPVAVIVRGAVTTGEMSCAEQSVAGVLAVAEPRVGRRRRSARGLVRDLAAGAVAAAGLRDVRVSAAATHVDVSPADHGEVMRDLLERFAHRGIGPGLVLVAGDFAPGGDDVPLLVPELDRAVVVSLGRRTPGGRVRPAVRHHPAA
jgi:hypothetical protein